MKEVRHCDVGPSEMEEKNIHRLHSDAYRVRARGD